MPVGSMSFTEDGITQRGSFIASNPPKVNQKESVKNSSSQLNGDIRKESSSPKVLDFSKNLSGKFYKKEGSSISFQRSPRAGDNKDFKY